LSTTIIYQWLLQLQQILTESLLNLSSYKNQQLYLENVSILELAAEVKTPFYCYSQQTIIQAYQNYRESLGSLDSLICYAIKANSNQAIIKTLATCGAGADVVSEGELRRALMAGIPANKIVYSGVAKTANEMKYALSQEIFQFNVESENELLALNQVAQSMNRKAPIAFRINPDIDANTHAKISTGKSENKFGIPICRATDMYALAGSLSHIDVQGIDVHIGSQLSDLRPFKKTFEMIKNLIDVLKSQGHDISVIDVGGGLGVNYEGRTNFPTTEQYCEVITNSLKDSNCKIILEPGRSLVAESGLLITQVVYKKITNERTFVIIDAAMNDLLRPSMYDAYHPILAVNQTNKSEISDIVGPVCETGDTFAKAKLHPELNESDLIAISHVGAYGAVMASTYNTRLMIPEVLIYKSNHCIIKERGNYLDLINQDKMADWQID
jgi:diaminopimelate decarboxylase